MSQKTWERCLYAAAHNGQTLKQAVIAYQHRERTNKWPVGVKPEPMREMLGQKVAALWPEYTNRPWLAK